MATEIVKQADGARLMARVEVVASSDFEMDSVALMLAASRMCGDPAVRLRVLDYVVTRVRDEVTLMPERVTRKAKESA